MIVSDTDRKTYGHMDREKKSIHRNGNVAKFNRFGQNNDVPRYVFKQGILPIQRSLHSACFTRMRLSSTGTYLPAYLGTIASIKCILQ